MYHPAFAGLPDEICTRAASGICKLYYLYNVNAPIPGVNYFTVVSLQPISDDDLKKQRDACYGLTGGAQLCDKQSLPASNYGAVLISRVQVSTIAAGNLPT